MFIVDIRKEKGDKGKKDEDVSESESEPDIRRKKKRRRPNINYMDDPRFSPRRTRNRKISGNFQKSIFPWK